MIELRLRDGALTLYASHEQPPRAMWIVGSVVAAAALYFYLQQQIADPTIRLVSAAICIAGPIVAAMVLYMRAQATSIITSFDIAARRIHSTQKLDRGSDVVVEVGFDDVVSLKVTEDNPERPRNNVLSLQLADRRKVKLAMQSRQYSEKDQGQDLRKVAAFLRTETGLPD